MSSQSSYGCLVPIILILGLILISILNHWWLMLGVIVLVVVLLFLGFIILIEALIAASFRDKYGTDFLFTLQELILFFKRRGYSLENYFGAGSSNPSVILSKASCSNVKIILHAPLLFGRQYIEVFEEKEPSKKWKFDKSNYSDAIVIDKILSPYFGSASVEVSPDFGSTTAFGPGFD